MRSQDRTTKPTLRLPRTRGGVMTETLIRTSGGFRGHLEGRGHRPRRGAGLTRHMILRLVIWFGLGLYALYLSAAAMAGAGTESGTSAPTPAQVTDLGELSGLTPMDRIRAVLPQRPTPGDPMEEIACLALNIYFEARGEPDDGKLAVGHVVMNRVMSERFPDTVCEVVRQGGELRRYRCQFTWWCDGRSDTPRSRPDWEHSTRIALAVYWGRTEDPTDGALWYHADYVSPKWRTQFIQGPKIGRHIFYWEPERVASREVSRPRTAR
ncbi:MAG: cell wall hydrolase [Alphaproteobacteria bacterium]|nr:MAG: cell wall hydrolase [Alphaproteobacteria bacterium]